MRLIWDSSFEQNFVCFSLDWLHTCFETRLLRSSSSNCSMHRSSLSWIMGPQFALMGPRLGYGNETPLDWMDVFSGALTAWPLASKRHFTRTFYIEKIPSGRHQYLAVARILTLYLPKVLLSLRIYIGHQTFCWRLQFLVCFALFNSSEKKIFALPLFRSLFFYELRWLLNFVCN